MYEVGCTTVGSSKGWFDAPSAWNPSNWSGSVARSRVYTTLAMDRITKNTNTSRLWGITSLDSFFMSILLSRLTAGGCSSLTSGWQTRNDGVASFSWLSTLHVGVGEHWQVDGGVRCKMGRFWNKVVDVVVLVVSLLTFEAVSLFILLFRFCTRVLLCNVREDNKVEEVNVVYSKKNGSVGS